MTLPTAAIGTRGTEGYSYAEVATVLGPETIGDTADNSYSALYGRPYALVLDHETRRLRLFRGAVGGGSYEEVEVDLPAILFDVVYPAGARRFTAAFDQSARIIVAYELDGVIRVTRWTGSAYVQNVTFDGVDPALLMDATLADPRGYPTAADDGWSVREAFDAGIRVFFEWLAEDPPTFRDNPITDSDVVLFYLTPERTGVRARVQRQLYATVQTLADLPAPVVLDRAIALAGRYELLLSDEAGDVRGEMLVSAPYIGDYLINPEPISPVEAGIYPETIRLELDTYVDEPSDELAGALAPDVIALTSDTALRSESEDVDATLTPDPIAVVGNVYIDTVDHALEATLAPVDAVVVTVTELVPSSESVAATLTPEVIRVQTV